MPQIHGCWNAAGARLNADVQCRILDDPYLLWLIADASVQGGVRFRQRVKNNRRLFSLLILSEMDACSVTAQDKTGYLPFWCFQRDGVSLDTRRWPSWLFRPCPARRCLFAMSVKGRCEGGYHKTGLVGIHRLMVDRKAQRQMHLQDKIP